MTDLAELKRLAEAAREENIADMNSDNPFFCSTANADFRDVCGQNTILSLIERVERAEADLAFALDNETVRAASYKAGRAEALEEAAKVARHYEDLWRPAAGFGDRAVAAKIIADTIGALGEKAG